MKDKNRKLLEEIREQRRIFWEEEYPNYSLSQKKSYWLASIHRGMRANSNLALKK